MLCKVVADMIKGRDPQDIRKVFHAPDPLGDWTGAQEGDSNRHSFLSTTSSQDTNSCKQSEL